MPAPKILVLVNGFEGPLAEAGRKNVASAVAQWNGRFRICFLGLSRRDGRSEYLGFPVFSVGSPGYDGRYGRNGYAVGAVRLLARGRAIVRAERPDLVLCAMETASTGMLALALRRVAGLTVPVVQWFWSDAYDATGPRRHWLSEHLPHLALNGRRLGRAALRRVDAVLASSRHLERRAVEAGAKRVCFAPSGVDLEHYRPPAAPPSEGLPLVIAYVGHLTYSKGVSLLVDAVEPLLESGRVTLLLAASGTSDEESSLLARVRGRPGVELLGVCDPATVFARADLTVLPRRFSYGTASWPNVVLESLACGTPVLTSRLPGIDEIVRDGENGFLLPPGEAAPLREALARFAAEPERVRALRMAARASVENRGWPAAAATMADAVEGALR